MLDEPHVLQRRFHVVGEGRMKFEAGDLITLKYEYAYSPSPIAPAIVLEVIRGGYKVLAPTGIYELSSDYAHESCQLLQDYGAKSATGEV